MDAVQTWMLGQYLCDDFEGVGLGRWRGGGGADASIIRTSMSRDSAPLTDMALGPGTGMTCLPAVAPSLVAESAQQQQQKEILDDQSSIWCTASVGKGGHRIEQHIASQGQFAVTLFMLFFLASSPRDISARMHVFLA